MAAPSSMRLSVLGVEAAAKNIQSGKYGKQRLFLLFKIRKMCSALSKRKDLSKL